MIAYEVPGMVFFAQTGEYGMGDGTNWACNHSMGKWFRQVIPQDPRLISCGKNFVAIAYGM